MPPTTSNAFMTQLGYNNTIVHRHRNPAPPRPACQCALRLSSLLLPHCRPLPPFHINTPTSTPCVFQPSLLNSHSLLLLILTAPFDISYCFLLQCFQLFVALALPATFSVSCHIWRQLARSKRGGSAGGRVISARRCCAGMQQRLCCYRWPL